VCDGVTIGFLFRVPPDAKFDSHRHFWLTPHFEVEPKVALAELSVRRRLLHIAETPGMHFRFVTPPNAVWQAIDALAFV
jgi:hypothetical protein